MAARLARTVVVVLAIITLFIGWYAVASNYDYDMLSGTYLFREGAVTSRLSLHSDQTFDQILIQDGKVFRAKGSWRRIGEGGVTFSKDMLRLPGQQTYLDRFGPDRNGDTSADQEFGGDFQKFLGIYPSLNLD